ncbi:MAG: hypothetical protein ACLSHC_08945 [Bilophila wadsworthia]
MKQSELIALIERTAPLAIAAPWIGRVFGSLPHGRISSASPCADPTPESIRIALSGG